MNRRTFLRSASGLLLPLGFPGIISAITPQQQAAILNQKPRQQVSGNSPIANWFDAQDPATKNADAAGNNGLFNGCAITVTDIGYITKCRIYVSVNTSAVDVKMAVYSVSGSLLASTLLSTGSGTGWKYGTLNAQILNTASTTYRLYQTAASSFMSFAYRSSAGTNYYKFLAYSSFPTDPSGSVTTGTDMLCIGLGGNS